MIWVATGITFLTAVVIVVAFAYAFSSGVWPTAERLTRLWHPPSVTPEAHFRERQKERVQRVLTDVGKLLPASTKQLSRTQRLLVRAGYRNPETATVMRGVKILLPLGLLSLIFFTKIYRQNLAFFALAGLLGLLLPEFWLTWRIRRRQHRIRLGLPDALDLLVVCVEAGLGLDQAIVRVSQELRITHPQLSEELQLVNLEMRVGKTRFDSLRELAVRPGVDGITALAARLIQTAPF